MNVRKNDTIILLKDFTGPSPMRKGATARVLRVLTKKHQLICEGVNVKHKHVRANTNRDMPRGGITRKEAPVDISNVALYCPKCAGKTKPEQKTVDGKKSRVCRKCGHALETST